MGAFFFGLGYSSQAAGQNMQATGLFALIGGTVRSPEKAAALQGLGVGAVQFDGTQASPAVSAALRTGVSHVVASIAPDADGDPVLRHHRADLDAAADLGWLCYYSTVGVYGDFDGAWIDETATLDPRNERSVWRVQAEKEWRDYAAARGVPLLILRLAGIYGPGRSTFDKLRDGTARRVVKQGQVFNRIHVEDIGRVTALAAVQRLAGTYNLADDLPAPPQDLVTHAAALLDMEPPPEVAFEDAQFTSMQRSFYADNKRVSNAAIKAALGIDLLYPDYRTGLAAILKAEQ